MRKVILSIDGMSCSACSSSLEKYLNKQKGIIFATVNLVLSQASIEYNDEIELNDLGRFVQEAGFKSLGVYNEVVDKRQKSEKMNLIIFSILSILVLYISMAHMIYFPVISFLDMDRYPINYSICLLILSCLYLVYGFDILKNGYKSFIRKSPNMNTLVSIGVLSGFIYSLFGTILILFGRYEYVHNLYFESSCLVIFFIKLGRFIDSRSREKTKEAIKDLVQITPKFAFLKTEDGERKVTIDEVKKGDILICKPGMKVAVDGVIVKGSSHFDEAFITGEAKPSKKDIKSKVLAGSLNIDGYIEYRADKIGRESMISEVVKLVVEATNTKAPISKIADKVSCIFVPSIMVIAFLTFIGYLFLGLGLIHALQHFVTVLVVACPCALGLATPLAIVVSEGICAKNGILVKSSEILENVHKVSTVIFDKTGTLTYGDLKISEIFNYSDKSDDELIQIVASIEKHSSHPISNAFMEYVKRYRLKTKKAENFLNLMGVGVSGTIGKNKYYIGNNKVFDQVSVKNSYKQDEVQLSKKGHSVVYVVENNDVVALIGVRDVVREDAKELISNLEKLNKSVVMLTGDNESSAKIVAKEVGIDTVIANVLPKDKVDVVKKFMNSSGDVMMVGDGINDAPSLAAATIGVSISSGTDIANNSADVILMNDKLINLINLITISKMTIRNIRQNLFWAFFYNVCIIPVAVGLFSGWNIDLNPMVASIAMMLSSLTVIFNTLRLRKIKLRR